MVHILIDQSKSNLDLTGANDCTINQENYAISSDNFVIQFRKNTWINGSIMSKVDHMIPKSTEFQNFHKFWQI